MFLSFSASSCVGPLRRRLRQMVPPVEDDEVADQAVDVPDPVAHLGALVGRVRAQRRIGKGLVEIFADRAALVQRPAVMDQRRDHAERIDLQIFRRMMLHLRHVDDMALIGEALLLEAEPHAARSARTPAVVKDHHGRLPKTGHSGLVVGSVVPRFGDPGQGPAHKPVHAFVHEALSRIARGGPRLDPCKSGREGSRDPTAPDARSADDRRPC